MENTLRIPRDNDIYLDENELELKKNLIPIMMGEWDNKLTDEEQRQVRTLSFFYNHISYIDDHLIFSYCETLIKLRTETDLTMPIQGEMTYIDYLFILIRSEQRFNKAFTEFLRDFKIDSIIGSDS